MPNLYYRSNRGCRWTRGRHSPGRNAAKAIDTRHHGWGHGWSAQILPEGICRRLPVNPSSANCDRRPQRPLYYIPVVQRGFDRRLLPEPRQFYRVLFSVADCSFLWLVYVHTSFRTSPRWLCVHQGTDKTCAYADNFD